VSNRFFYALQDQFEIRINDLKLKVKKIDEYKRLSDREKHASNRRDYVQHVQLLEEQLGIIKTLLGVS